MVAVAGQATPPVPAPVPAFVPAPAPTSVPAPTPTPFDGAGDDLAGAFSGGQILWSAGAVVATGLMAFGGVDHAIRVGVQRGLRSPAYGEGAYYTGYLLPAIVAPAVYIVGLAARDPVVAGAGSAALQALAETFVATSVLKIAVGRAYPLDGGDPNAPDRLDHPEHARDFRPFQTLWPLPAWPSGHVSATISIAAALTAYYPEEPWIPLLGYPVAALIGFGMVVRDSHWASDVVGGALLGHAIGYSVGAGFRRRVRGARDANVVPLTLVPVVGPSFAGVALGRAW
jgi:membrane-associated phospholipid phosphatase